MRTQHSAITSAILVAALALAASPAGAGQFNGQNNVYWLNVPDGWINDSSIAGTSADATFRTPQMTTPGKSDAIMMLGLSPPHTATLDAELAQATSGDQVDQKSNIVLDGAHCLSAHTSAPSTQVICRLSVDTTSGPRDLIFFAQYFSQRYAEGTYLGNFWSSVNSIHFASNVRRY